MNDLHRAQMAPALGGLAIGAMMLCAGAFGVRGRLSDLSHHGPFAFDEYTTLDTAFAIFGLLVVIVSLVYLVPIWRHVSRVDRVTLAFLARAGMPRSLYELLLGVAATDGRIDRDERELVARVMTRELPDAVTAQDLKNWSTTVEPPRDPIALAQRLVPLLTPTERANVVAWCRAVATIDGTNDAEHDVLQGIRRVLVPLELPRR